MNQDLTLGVARRDAGRGGVEAARRDRRAVIFQSSYDSSSFTVPDVQQAALAGLERRVLQHDDHLRRLDADAEEDASAILANQNSLVRLSEMVYYFRQNVLKVKKLPAMMNALERRIEVLDDNFAKLILSRPRSNEDTEVEDEGV